MNQLAKTLVLKSLVLALLVGLTGCFLPAREPSITMHADTSFTFPERECLEVSAEQWRTQTQGLADISLKYDYNSSDPASVALSKLQDRLVRWTSKNPVLIEYEAELNADKDPDAPAAHILGQVNGNGIKDKFHLPVEMRMVMDRLEDPHDCRLTAIHEFGHVLGVPHITTSHANIMYPVVEYSRKACLKKDDLLGFCYFNDCGNVQMKACEE